MSRINIERLEAEFLTTSQAAHVIGIPRQRVYELVKESRLRGAHVGKDAPGGRGVLLVDAASCETYRRELAEMKGQ
jgi:excisionase family DNA binding protein